MVLSAVWNTASGNWFGAGNWDADNPNPPPGIVNRVPNANDIVKIPDNSTVATPFTISYNGTSSVYAIQAASNCTLNLLGGTLNVLHGGFGLGRINVSAGATLRVDDDTTNFWFNSGDLNGTLSGNGLLRFVNGTFNLNAGLSVTVENWWLTYQVGSGTVSTTELNTNLTYANNFQLRSEFGNYPILNLNTHTLTLSGTVLIDGQVHESGTVRVTGTGSVAGGFFADGAKLQVSSTLQQIGTWALGGGTLQIDAGATYTITTASDINIVFSSTSTIVNNGTLSDTAVGLSRINGDLTNNGTMTIAAGANLVLQTGTQALNGTVSGAGTLSFGFDHHATLNTTTLSVAAIYINGGNAGGTVFLGKSLTYAGSFTLDDQFGNLDLNGFTLTLSGTVNLNTGYIDGPGTLRVTGTATLGAVAIGDVFGGATGSAATLRNSGTINQVGHVSVNGTIQNDAGRTYTLGSFNITGGADGTFNNAGTLAVTASATFTGDISTNFINTGTVTIASGAQLRLSGVSTLGGAVNGAGTLTLAGSATVNTGAITTGALAFNGTTTLGTDLSYGGAFSIGTFSTTNLAGHTLTLSGAATLNTGFNTINDGTLRITGTATISGVGLGTGGTGGALTLQNAGTINQDISINLNGTIQNLAGRTYTLASANITGGAGGTFANAGTLAVNAVASFTGDISTNFTNTGTVTIANGATLRLSGTSTLGGTVGGAGTLVLAGNATVNGPITTGALAFNGLTTLGANLSYAGNFSIGTFSTTNLNGRTLTLSGTSSFTSGFNVVNGAGSVVITGSSTIGGVAFGNTVPAVTLRNSGTIEQIGGISLNGTFVNDAGRTILMSIASNITNLGNGGTVTNNGTFTKDGDSGTGTISTLFTNNGLVRVLEGTLDFQNFVHVGVIQGAISLSGTRTIVNADAAGELTLTGGTGNNRIVVTSAPTHVDGGAGTDTLVIGASMTLAAGSVVGIERFEVGNGVTANLSALSNGGIITLASTAGGGSTVFGTKGADTIVSGAGLDTMRGGLGNDVYSVNHAGDRVFEAAGQGTDRIASSVSYTLAAGQSVEALYLADAAATTALNLIGNEQAQTLIGNAGANTLIGGGGADALHGLGGNDVYGVDNAGDLVFEAAGQGTDRVASSVSYTLAAGQSVETLYLSNAASTAALNLIGNEVAQSINGNAGANTLIGGGGADALRGLAGNDVYGVDNAGDLVFEAAGQGTDRVASSVSYTLAAGQSVETLHFADAAATAALNLIGNELAQSINGNAGNNILDGGRGADILRGLSGNDSFQFSTALGSGNYDHIVDFSVPADTIRLDRSIFTTLALGTLTASAFKDIGDPGAVVDADDRILYNDDNGALYYDSNGSAAGGRIQFATLDNKPAVLTAADFFIIA